MLRSYVRCLFGVVFGVLFNSSGAFSQTVNFVDFEEFSGSNIFTGIEPPLAVGPATFSGGQVLDATTFLPANPTTVYGTAFFCPGCLPTITIDFAEPAASLSLDVLNGQTFVVTYFVEDDQGGMTQATLASNANSGAATLTLPSSGIRQVTITSDAGNWDFFIDNISFVTEVEEFMISFTSFIPSDNVQGPPLEFCFFGAMPPERRRIFFKGDNRGFDPAANSFRLRQRLTVITDEAVDPDGLKEGTIQNLVGQSRSYAEDALDDGVIDDNDEDGIANDCTLFHDSGTAAPDNMEVEVFRETPTKVFIRMEGGPGMPLSLAAQVFGRVDWLVTLTIDTVTEPPEWVLAGTHDGFPAYELYINDMEIYRYSPAEPLLTFRVRFKMAHYAERAC